MKLTLKLLEGSEASKIAGGALKKGKKCRNTLLD